MVKTKLEKAFRIFISNASKRGATNEELETLIRALDLIKKYQPVEDKES